jgi:hypothetical protein
VETWPIPIRGRWVVTADGQIVEDMDPRETYRERSADAWAAIVRRVHDDLAKGFPGNRV